MAYKLDQEKKTWEKSRMKVTSQTGQTVPCPLNPPLRCIRSLPHRALCHSPTTAVPLFLTNPSCISRHLDEYERTPFEVTTPRHPAPSPSSFASSSAVVRPTESEPRNVGGEERGCSGRDPFGFTTCCRR
uniref:Uncharacterized protein n=1 Tax=Oryza brachyantha TaxID=4533 RepID=J3LRY1_ORYBR